MPATWGIVRSATLGDEDGGGEFPGGDEPPPNSARATRIAPTRRASVASTATHGHLDGPRAGLGSLTVGDGAGTAGGRGTVAGARRSVRGGYAPMAWPSSPANVSAEAGRLRGSLA